jgi:hypothetical protein
MLSVKWVCCRPIPTDNTPMPRERSLAAWRRLLIALGIGIVVIVYRFPRTSMVVVTQWGAWNAIETAKALGRLHTGLISAPNTFLVSGLTQCAHIHAVQITHSYVSDLSPVGSSAIQPSTITRVLGQLKVNDAMPKHCAHRPTAALT